jgi:formylglycine-generating enzyme required for sulfatase activity
VAGRLKKSKQGEETMKRTALMLCLVCVLVIGGYVPVKAELAIHSAVKLEASELDNSQTYYILNSPDMMNWSFLKGKVTDLGPTILVETGGDSIVSVDGAYNDANIFIDTQQLRKQFYMTMHFPPGGSMVLVPAGEFQMGDTFGEGSSDELPVHTVYLDAYYIDKYEVTNAEYVTYLNEAMAEGLIEIYNDDVYNTGHTLIYLDLDVNSEIDTIGGEFTVASGYESYPVRWVSWYGASRYAQSIGKRLPTEAEWEKAAGWNPETQTKTRYAWGNDPIDSTWCNYNSYYGYSRTTPVGYFDGTDTRNDAKSWYGCYDMNGNVWEWVNDWYSSYSSGYQENPQGPVTGTHRVLRDGFWFRPAAGVRSAIRDYATPISVTNGSGFRCAMDVAPPAGMTYVKAGKFTMGDIFGDGQADELPVHEVYLDAYYIDKYEVTNAHYVAYLNAAMAQGLISLSGGDVYDTSMTTLYMDMSSNASIVESGGAFSVSSGRDNYPVCYVSFEGANVYAQFVGKRLPTEAEWEKAAS